MRQRQQEPDLPHRSRRHGRQTMDNNEVSPPSPLLFANPRARCHISDVATRWRTIIIHRLISTQHNMITTDGWRRQATMTTMLCNGKVSTRTATRAHHHPPRRWPITTPSISNEDPGPAPPHEHRQRPSTTPPTMTTAQHHPMNDDNSPASPHQQQ